MSRMRILIYGFGRMGITHYAILNSILTEKEFTFVEPNQRLNFLAKKNIKGKFISNDKKLNEAFDLTLITTPPFIHESLVEKSISRGDKLIFVEKPFGGHHNSSPSFNQKRIYVGYVLRFNPIVNWIKKNVKKDEVNECYAEYLSNTIENKPKGWRNGEYSGVLNEMGSHIIDLINYLFDLQEFKVINKHIKSIVSDVDDEVSAEINSKGRKFSLYFNWVNKKIRKPMFKVRLKLNDGRFIVFDQQKITITKNNVTENISVVDLVDNIPYYLRGVDFTKQMMDLVGPGEVICDWKQALVVNQIMKEIIKE